MIPITRKEYYLNRIVGNNDYETPEKPITTEEFFFAEILGEAVQAPEPLPRYQMYLAKIAGREIEIPYPEVRLEYFLAKAAGMDIETPTPITREEIYWSNYTAIVEFEVEGVPPLTYKAIEGTLENYRIYGNTVDGESVGDRTRNLFDMKKFAELCYPRYASVTFADNTLSFTSTAVDAYVNYVCGEGDTVNYEYRPSCIDVLPSTTYTISMSSVPKCYISWIDNSYKAVSAYTRIPTNQKSYTFTTPSNCTKLLIRLGKEVTNIGDTFTISNIMLNAGSTALPYEPYGYKVPVTVEGKNLFDESATSTINGYKDGAYINRLGGEVSESIYAISEYILIPEGANMISMNVPVILFSPSICFYGNDKTYISGANYNNRSVVTESIPIGSKYLRFTVVKQYADTTMLNEGSTALPYEPYHAPVTTPIYLPEQIKKVGDEEEYIDFNQQKQHRIGAEDIDVTLPALPTLAGTNVLSVGTAVQPSKVYVKYKGERQ